jgi:hypothetical protein
MSKKKKKKKKKKRKRRKKTRLPFASNASEGTVKMSVVLLEFIKPYMYLVRSLNEMHNLIGIGMIAWNLSFLSKQEQVERVEETIEKKLPFFSADSDVDIERIIWELIERKKSDFSQHDLEIVTFEINEKGGDNFALNVISTPVIRGTS